jgi:hypothetical protein
VPGVAIYGVRRLDAAFIALESGSKLPHSIAGRNRRPGASIVLPHQRNIKTRQRGSLRIDHPIVETIAYSVGYACNRCSD